MMLRKIFIQAPQNRLESLSSREGKPLLVIGDINFCYLTSEFNVTKQYMERKQFIQMINEPTHIEGHLLDQAYLRDKDNTLSCTVEVQSKYYTDHKGLALIIKRRSLENTKQ